MFSAKHDKQYEHEIMSIFISCYFVTHFIRPLNLVNKIFNLFLFCQYFNNNLSSASKQLIFTFRKVAAYELQHPFVIWVEVIFILSRLFWLFIKIDKPKKNLWKMHHLILERYQISQKKWWLFGHFFWKSVILKWSKISPKHPKTHKNLEI